MAITSNYLPRNSISKIKITQQLRYKILFTSIHSQIEDAKALENMYVYIKISLILWAGGEIQEMVNILQNNWKIYKIITKIRIIFRFQINIKGKSIEEREYGEKNIMILKIYDVVEYIYRELFIDLFL